MAVGLEPDLIGDGDGTGKSYGAVLGEGHGAALGERGSQIGHRATADHRVTERDVGSQEQQA